MSNNIPSYQDLQNLVVKLESENKILQLENRFNLLLKASEDMITIHKLNGEYTYYNGPSCYAITPKDVVGKKIDDLFDKEISTKLLKTFKKVQKTGKSETIEVLIDWLGEKKWFSEYIYPLKNEEGKVVELAKVCRDIHKRKIAEQIIEKQNKEKELQLKELEASKQKVETTLKLLEKIEYSKNEASKMAKIGFWDFDSVNNVISWSDYMYQIFGLNLEDGPPTREKFITFFDKESQKILADAAIGIVTEGKSYSFELKILNLRKEEVWIKNVLQPIYNQQNIVVGRRGVMQDITESKQAQFYLEVSNRKIETSLALIKKKEYSLSESSRIAKIGHWEYDIALDSFIWSDYIYEIYGLDILDKIPQRKDLVSLYDKESQKKLIKATIDLTKAGTSYDIELRLINFKQQEVWVRMVVHLIYDDKNKIVGRRGVVHNITASKNAQLELELSKQKTQTSLEQLTKKEADLHEVSSMAKIGYWNYNIEKAKIVWSDFHHEIFGVDPKDGIPSREKLLSYFDLKSQKMIEEANQKLNFEGKSYDIEVRLVNEKKREVWVRNVVQPVYDDKNKFIGRRGLLQDITETKHAQIKLELSKQEILTALNKLEKNEHALKEATNIGKIGFIEYSNITDTFFWSDYAYEIFGFDAKKGIPSQKDVAAQLDNESLKKLKKVQEDLNLRGKGADIELKGVNQKNKEIWIRQISQPIFNNEYKVIGRKALLQDITSYKLAQTDLELSNHKIKTTLALLEKSEYSKNEASKMAKIGYLEDDIATETYIWSEYLYDIFGFDSKKPVPSRKEIAILFDSVSQKKMSEATFNLDKKGIPFDLELKMINLRKEEVWIRIVVEPIYNHENKIYKRRGVLQDITASKKAQIELENSKQKIQTTLALLEKSEYSKNEASKIAKIGYWEVNTVNNNIIWSDHIHHIIGSDPKKGVPDKKDIEKKVSKEYFKKFTQATLELVTTGKPYDIELKFINLKGKEVWIRIVAQPIFNDKKIIVGRRGILQDITIAKKAQQELEASKQTIQESLELLEKRKYSIDEASNIAKIGFWEVDFINDKTIWSAYMHQLFGSDPNKEVPKREEIRKRLSAKSLNNLRQRTLGTLKGIPYDIELKFLSLNDEVVWVRNVAQPVFNSKNKVIGRRGVLQNITASKKAQKELENSKQKIQESLEQLAKRNISMDEASKVAKIGFWEVDLINDKTIWSDYIHQLFGSDPKKAPPIREAVEKRLSPESLIAFQKGNLGTLEGVPYDIELKFLSLNDEVVWVRNVAQPVFNSKNKVIGRRGVLQNITASKKAQKELENSKQKIQESLEQLAKRNISMDEASKVAKIGFWEVDLINDKTIWSDYIHQLFGSDPKKAPPIREAVEKRLSPESLKAFQKGNLGILEGVPYDIELKFLSLKGKVVWVRNVAQPVFNCKNKVIGKRGVLQNITASKKAQQELENSKQKIQESLEQLAKRNLSMDEASKVAKIGYWEHELINESVVWSDYMHEILGSDPKKGIPDQNSIMENFDLKSQEIFGKATKDLLFIGQSYDIELKYNNPKKGEVWIRNVAQPIYNKQNKVVGKRGVLQDITASKIAQQELEISNQKIKTTLDLLEKSEYSKNDASKMAKIGYLEEEINTDKRVWSESLYHIFGFDIKSGPPTTEEIASLFSEEFQIKIVESIANLDVNGVPFDIELQMTNIRKEKIWIRAMLHPIYNQNKELTGRRGVIQDITDQKIKQQELDQKNEELYKVNNALNEAQKLSRIGNWEWNMQTDEAIWSDEMYNIYGVTRDSFYPSHKNVSKTVYPDDRHKFKTAINSLLVNKIFVPFEFRMIHPSGELRHLYIMALEKKFDYNVFGVTKDITDRKKIELKNKIITDRYIELFDNATVSIWNEDLTLVFKEINKLRKLAIPNIKVYLEENPELMFFLLKKVKINKVNKATLKLFDAKNSEQFLDNIELTFGKDADKVFAGLIEAIWNNNKTYVSEVNYKTIKGVEFAAIVSIPIPQTTTEQKTVPVSIQSIQSIKVAEAAKIDSIKKLNEAQKIAKIGSWLYIPLTQEVIWSEETYRIFGYDPKKEPPNFKVLLKSINIKDQELVFNSFNSEASFDIEHRNYMPNGDEKWIRTICEPTFDEKGVLISFRGSNQDITERKLISRKIEKAEEMYRLLADNSNDLICLHEPDSTFKYISPSIKDILGYDASEKIGKLGFSLIYKEDVQIFRESIEQRIFNKIPNTTFYCRAQHKNGDILWLEFSASAVFSNNKPDYILTSSRDITEWMLAKQEIQEYQASLQKLTAEVSLIEEKQKKEIATNIHDHLSQSLVVSKMRINELKKNPQLKVIDEDLQFIESHISEALENSRKITYELSPPVLYQLGIVDALNWLFENIEATHKITCKVVTNVDAIDLGEVKSILLYRSIQEVIKNAIKYADATLLTLKINKDKLGIHLLLSDNGNGFDTSVLNNYQSHSGSGFGLFAVQERIKNIQGKFKITSEINTGTSVKIFIPLNI